MSCSFTITVSICFDSCIVFPKTLFKREETLRLPQKKDRFWLYTYIDGTLYRLNGRFLTCDPKREREAQR